jgi:hypothetical protein
MNRASQQCREEAIGPVDHFSDVEAPLRAANLRVVDRSPRFEPLNDRVNSRRSWALFPSTAGFTPSFRFASIEVAAPLSIDVKVTVPDRVTP